MAKVKTRMFNNSWLRQREIGQRFPLGHSDRFSKKLYSSILPCTSWDHGENLRHAMHGGVFNLEFSPDGSLLVAACEKKSILMFDPLCRKLIHAVDNAHRDCVNCVRFLDSRVFATCSDDSTVALWDARNLKSHIRSLHGHSNWVKNIEFSPRDGLLVTSGFDGSIYTWDINSYTENGFVYNRVFHTNGLMRTRLNPDASKMIICTTGGYLIIIHNLDLKTMAQDLAGFKPNMYRLMQLSQTTIPVVADFTHLFSQQRRTNRVEFVTDFPVGDDAEVVSSLQIHPHGWCALSRNISNDENSEWTCVHDIQDRDGSESETDANVETDHEADCSLPPPGEPDVDKQQRQNRRGHQRPLNQNAESDSDSESETGPTRQQSQTGSRGMVSTAASSLVIGPNSRARIVRPMVELRMDSAPAVRAAAVAAASAVSRVMESGSPHAPRVVDDGIPLDTRRRGTVGEMGRRGLSPANVELHVSSADVWEALVAIREARVRRERERQRLERERAMSMRMRNLEQRFLEERRQSLVRIVVRRNTEGEGTTASTSASSQESEQQREISGQSNNNQEASGTGNENSRVSSNSVAAEGATASGSSLSNALAAVISATNAAVARTGARVVSTSASSVSSRGNEASGSDSGNVIAQVSIGIRNTGRETREAASERRPSIRAVEMGVLDMIGDRSFQMGMATRGAMNNHTILVMDNQPERYGSSSGGTSSRVPAYHSSHSCHDIPRNQHIHQNVRRLTHFIEEPNVGKGFIKELCFSADGRLICSPFGYGVRLLAFSPDCSELSTCLPSKPPVQLYELTTNVCHSDIVVSTKFSPQHCLLVSGCLSGKIVWHQPVM